MALEDDDVARAQPHLECGIMLGSLAIKKKKNQQLEIIKFYCTRARGHRDRCAFVGTDLLVLKRKL